METKEYTVEMSNFPIQFPPLMSGQLQFLRERVGLSQNTDDLYEFEKTFIRYHHGILLTKIIYYQTEFGNMCFDKDTKPFVCIEQLGFFDDMNIFARRVNNELNAMQREKYDKTKPVKVSIMFRGGDSLEIHADNGGTKCEFVATFLDKNQEVSIKHYECMKYEINI